MFNSCKGLSIGLNLDLLSKKFKIKTRWFVDMYSKIEPFLSAVKMSIQKYAKDKDF